MLVATITALIILFSGGYEIFFAENVEKGIKEYVLEKDRRKELLDMTKEIKNGAKAYNKERKANFKDFEDLYTNYNSDEAKLQAFFDNLTEIQKAYQGDFIEKRIQITDKITDEEWKLIVQSSEEAYQKKLDKLAKKKSKTKDPFEKTRKKISEVPDAQSQAPLLEQLDSFSERISEFEKSMKDVNVFENELLVQKTNSKQELLTLYDDMNEIRQKAFGHLIGFHESVRSNVSEEQGETILSTFYKDLELAPM